MKSLRELLVGQSVKEQKTLLFKSIDFSDVPDGSVTPFDKVIVPINFGGQIKVVSYILSNRRNGLIQWKSGSRPLSGILLLTGTGNNFGLAGTLESWLMETEINQPLILTISNFDGGGHISYFLE